MKPALALLLLSVVALAACAADDPPVSPPPPDASGGEAAPACDSPGSRLDPINLQGKATVTAHLGAMCPTDTVLVVRGEVSGQPLNITSIDGDTAACEWTVNATVEFSVNITSLCMLKIELVVPGVRH